MSKPSLLKGKVLTFAVSLGFMPLGVAQTVPHRYDVFADLVNLGFMPLGVAQAVY